MRRGHRNDWLCTYLVAVDAAISEQELRDLAAYLSALGSLGCEAVVLDSAVGEALDEHRRVLRWVSKHLAVRREYLGPPGTLDLLRAAPAVAGSDKVVVASPEVRHTAGSLAVLCELLDRHEVVDPQDYIHPMPWWGGIEAAGMLLQRGVDGRSGTGATFGFRRGVIAGLRSLGFTDPAEKPLDRLQEAGADVLNAPSVLVRREAPDLRSWIRERIRHAGQEFTAAPRGLFYLTILPLLTLVAVLGGITLAATSAAMLGVGALALAYRGRAGATDAFPLRTCLFAPFAVFERSLSVYLALVAKVKRADSTSAATAAARSAGTRAASGQ